MLEVVFSTNGHNWWGNTDDTCFPLHAESMCAYVSMFLCGKRIFHHIGT